MAMNGSTKRLGFAGHCRILAAVSDDALTAQEVAKATGAHSSTVQRTLALARRYGLVGRVEWIRPVPHSRLVPRYRLGASDVSMPLFEEHARRKLAHSRSGGGAMALVTLLQMLRAEPLTRAELADDMRMHIGSIERMVVVIRQHGLIHIESWDRPLQGTTVARFGFGPGRDARRPPRKQNIIYQRAHRQRKRMAAQLGLLRDAA